MPANAASLSSHLYQKRRRESLSASDKDLRIVGDSDPRVQTDPTKISPSVPHLWHLWPTLGRLSIGDLDQKLDECIKQTIDPTTTIPWNYLIESRPCWTIDPQLKDVLVTCGASENAISMFWSTSLIGRPGRLLAPFTSADHDAMLRKSVAGNIGNATDIKASLLHAARSNMRFAFREDRSEDPQTRTWTGQLGFFTCPTDMPLTGTVDLSGDSEETDLQGFWLEIETSLLQGFLKSATSLVTLPGDSASGINTDVPSSRRKRLRTDVEQQREEIMTEAQRRIIAWRDTIYPST